MLADMERKPEQVACVPHEYRKSMLSHAALDAQSTNSMLCNYYQLLGVEPIPADPARECRVCSALRTSHIRNGLSPVC